ncbi:MAG: uracil-DNA glycosylase, partial [Vicinamibacterales bacterium]
MTASSRSSKPSRPTDARFDDLVSTAQACRVCPTMDGSIRVLSRANGPVPAVVMLVGEAPGRLGAGRTGVPFHGDSSGRRLDGLLESASWNRADIFITNAVLCNPLTPSGTNRPPTQPEIAACSGWLASQIEIVAPFLVVALGAVALNALNRIAPLSLSVTDAGRDPIAWHGRHLAAVYHPGARAQIHRPFALQHEDFAHLGRWLSARTTRESALMPEVPNSSHQHRHV